MSDSSARTFTGDFRRFFLRGLVVLLPSVLTLWIMVKAYQFVDNTIAEPINRSLRVMVVNVARVWEPLQEVFDPTEEALNSEISDLVAAGATVPATDVLRSRLRGDSVAQWWSEHWYMDLIGLGVAIIAVYIAGRLLGGFVGRRIYRKVEDVITQLPVFKQVYPYVKQVVDFLFSDERPLKFNRVVVIEYPRKGVWAVGFLTGDSLRSIRRKSGDSVSVFIPSSPTPFTGYTVTVPRDEIVELPISVEEAIRYTVSGGVLVPGHQQPTLSAEEDSTRPSELPSGLIPLPDPRDESLAPAERERGGSEAGPDAG